MNCSEHLQVAAVAQCSGCPRGLCVECAELYAPPMCQTCVGEVVASEKRAVRKQAAISASLGLFGMLLGFSMANADPNMSSAMVVFAMLSLGYGFAGIPWGWSVLTRITPNVFLFLPLFGWLLYFIAKFALAYLLGVFITPFKIWSLIRQAREAQKLVP